MLKWVKNIFILFNIVRRMIKSRTATFSGKEGESVRKIQAYQKEKRLSSFIEAVRQLCNDALQLKKITK